MKQLTQKYELQNQGGFSDTRLRFFVLGFMSLCLIMTPFLGMLASFIVMSIFGIFTAVKINEFQQSNPESILRHRQTIDRMYNYGAKAEYYEMLLKPYEKKRIVSKATKHKTAEKMSNINNLNFALSR